MKLQGTAVLILPHGNEEKTAKGIIIPKTVKNFTMTGDVIDAGPGCKTVMSGDKVYYNKRTATILEVIGKEDHHLVTEDNIFMVYGSNK